MKFPKPSERSLFALLVRSPFWISLLIAGALFAVARNFVPAVFAVATTIPFLGTAAFAGWRQFKIPSASRVAETLEALRAMTWPQFSGIIAEAFRREGYTVGEPTNGVVNLELGKNGYKTLVGCKRWKVAQTGAVPLRELADAMVEREARDCAYVVAGTLTEPAVAFAKEKGIRVLSGTDLAQFVARVLREGKG